MTIYILESHPLMCQAVSFLLRRIDPSKKLVEVHSFSRLQEAMLVNGQAYAFIVDPLMIGINGVAGIKQLKSNYPITPLIVFSSLPHEEAESACLAAGADLYVEKTESPQMVFSLISEKLGLSNKSPINKQQQLTSEGLIKLSKRQKQLLTLVDAGLGNEDIAKKLDISAHTVKVHLWRFYKKIGISSRTQLIKFARDNGYL